MSPLPAPDYTVDAVDDSVTLPCDHSFAYSTLATSIEGSDFSLENLGSTTDGAMYMEVSFECPRCQAAVTVELLESVIISKQ